MSSVHLYFPPAEPALFARARNHCPPFPSPTWFWETSESRDLHASDRRAWMKPSCFWRRRTSYVYSTFARGPAGDPAATDDHCYCYVVCLRSLLRGDLASRGEQGCENLDMERKGRKETCRT